MKSLRDIQKIVARFNVKPGPEMRSKVLDEALEIQRNQNQQSISDTKLNIWRIIMKNPITKFAAAAIVAIACLIGVFFWRSTGSSIALADVLARIEQVKAFRCQWSTKVTGEDPNKTYYEQRATSLKSQEHGTKSQVEQLDPNSGESAFKEWYWLPDKNTMILITPKEKKYWRIEAGDEFAKGLWKDSDPRTMTKRILECKYESMGRAIMDGIEVEGFQTTDPNWLGNMKDKVEVDVKIWVDVKTRLAVRYDFTYAYFDQMGDKIIKRVHFVMHDFQWDVPVDAAEFKPVIPDDYGSFVVKYPAHSTKETALQGLKLLAELFGKYPEKITDVDATVLRLAEKSETPAALRLKEEIKGLTDEEIMGSSKLADFWMPIRGLAMFWYVLEDNKKDPAYYGKVVTPKDADKILMRWKVSDKEYRVVYGDLHAETVTPAKLAELEAALPK
jgi:hypothetical protein